MAGAVETTLVVLLWLPGLATGAEVGEAATLKDDLSALDLSCSDQLKPSPAFPEKLDTIL